MTGLPPDALALLEDAQRKHAPSASDRERVLARLHASLGIAPVLGPAAPHDAPMPGAPAPHAPTVTPGWAEAAAVGKTSLLGGSAGTLLKWKAGKLLLASLVLGGAVGTAVVPMALERSTDAPTAAPARSLHAATVDAGLASVQVLSTDTTARGPARAERASRRLRQEGDDEHEGRRHRRARAPHEPSRARSAAPPEPVESPAVEPPEAAPVAPQPLATRSATASARRDALAADDDRDARGDEEEDEETAEEAEEALAAAHMPPERKQSAQKPALAETATQELALIRRALTSLRDQDPKRALVLLNEHEADYPRGAFSTERKGLRVIALCAAGHVEQGREEQQAFLRQASTSPIAERVRRACGEGTP